MTVYKLISINAKLRNGESGQEAELTGGSALRGRRYALDCSAIDEEQGEKEGGEGEEEWGEEEAEEEGGGEEDEEEEGGGGEDEEEKAVGGGGEKEAIKGGEGEEWTGGGEGKLGGGEE